MNPIATILLSLLTAAEPAPPAGTGRVVGRVIYPEAPEAARQLPVRVNRSVCGQAPIYSEDLVVAPDGGLAFAVVHIDGAPPTEAAPKTLKLEQEGCVFRPHVQSATRGAILDIGNSDDVIHNVHGLIEGRTLFNLAMPIPGIRVKRTLSEPGVISLRCDSGHDWMSARVVVFSHSLHATSDRQGAFHIDGVPAGRHRVVAWHERLGTRAVEVDVRDGAEARVEIVFGAQSAPDEAAVEASPPPPTAPRPRTTDAAMVRAIGRPIFARHCATCHGVDGDGRGETKRYLNSHPRDFRTGSYMLRTTASGRLPTEEDLIRTIALGMPGSDMPGFRGRLTSDELRAVARYLTTLSPRFEAEGPAEPIEIPDPPPASAARVEAGRRLYERLRCAQCHGPGGDGDDADRVELEDDWGRPIVATDLTRGVFKGGPGPRPLYRTFSTGLDGTPMPSFADVLAPPDRWDLAYYVLSLRQGGVGAYLMGR